MRMIILAAAAALAFASGASAAPTPGSYSLNGAGKCVGPAPKTTFAKQSLCAAPAPPKHCKEPKTGKFAKCTAPGAVPA
jgi:hypothetical protein